MSSTLSIHSMSYLLSFFPFNGIRNIFFRTHEYPHPSQNGGIPSATSFQYDPNRGQSRPPRSERLRVGPEIPACLTPSKKIPTNRRDTTQKLPPPYKRTLFLSKPKITKKPGVLPSLHFQGLFGGGALSLLFGNPLTFRNQFLSNKNPCNKMPIMVWPPFL